MTAATVPKYSYQAILKDAARVAWQVEDLIGPDRPLDFTRPFLPEALVQAKAISGLDAKAALALNHIRSNSYLHLFGLVEEFILPLVVDHAKALGCYDIVATQAYLGFAAEESKHIRLFRQFAAAFEAGFGHRCEVIGPPQAIADFVLSHSPLGVALVTLHIEWMSQRHFLESVRHQQDALDPQFCSLLKHHWQEEAQHARLDALMVESMAQTMDDSGIATAIDDYIAIIRYLDQGFKAQVQLDIASLVRVTARTFSAPERDEMQRIQERSYQNAFLIAGMTHPNFEQSVRALSAAGSAQIAALAHEFFSDDDP
ncbi:hypothetical protein [Phormidium tenue]|uniref:Uncharacterized protein n=1 Tax=Phormidium tenue NIES-30 TaxID=549789 RepID=A0A1U7J5Q5_9CYAN|nr:hypothetical protein [Phormidium tenue]MBD2232427.1 hypothetical protein [Phormidium tenue FACHB-1052]OKH48086.1 hypothetical protein NIES30_11325 [Phormidium tenue NIES-30]